MKRAEQIFEEAKKEAEKMGNTYAYYGAVGALKANYDMLRYAHLKLKKELDEIKANNL